MTLQTNHLSAHYSLESSSSLLCHELHLNTSEHVINSTPWQTIYCQFSSHLIYPIISSPQTDILQVVTGLTCRDEYVTDVFLSSTFNSHFDDMVVQMPGDTVKGVNNNGLSTEPWGTPVSDLNPLRALMVYSNNC